MACPFFDPREQWSSDSWPGPNRVPLGWPWRGECTAGRNDETGGDRFPSEWTQIQFCNFGYARGRCARFPADTQADAHRFAFKRRNGPFFEILWIAERDCAPLSHHVFEVLPGSAGIEQPDQDEHPIAFRQAKAFAAACSDGKVPQPITGLDPS